MNKQLKFRFVISVFILFVCHPLFSQQQEGIQWINIFGGKGHENSPGFVSSAKGNAYFAFTFEKEVNIPGSDDTLQSTGGYDGIIAKYSKKGQFKDYWWLKSNGFISINSIAKRHRKIIIGGCFQDTLKIKKKSDDKESFVAYSPASLSGYILEITKTGQVVQTITTHTSYPWSYFSKVISKKGNIAANGIVLKDTVLNRKYNMLFYQDDNEDHNLLLSDINRQKINDLTYFKGYLLFCGAFKDTVVFGQDTLVPKSNRDAFFSAVSLKTDTVFTKTLKSVQNAEAVSLLKQDSILWVAVNFYDTLYIQDTIKIASKGAKDIALLKYNADFNLLNRFQIGGVLNERMDKLILEKKKVYLLTNIASPSTYVYHADSLQFVIEQNNVRGNAALFSLDSLDTISHLWLIEQDWANKITQVAKVSDDETIISGVLDKKMTVDSISYQSRGGQDAYIFRISDKCLNNLKSGSTRVRFCKGDSIFIPNVYEGDDGFLKFANDSSRGIYIAESRSVKLKIKESCGCINIDSIVFQETDAQKSGDFDDFLFEKRIISLFNDSVRIELDYKGDCLDEDDLFDITVQPNPFLNASELTVSANLPGTMMYRLFDLQGKPLTPQIEQKLYSGTTSYKLPVQTLPAGSYLLKVIFITEKYTRQKTIILMKK